MNSTLFRMCVVLSCLLAVSASDMPIPAKVEFNRDVRPILSDNCFYCHGPDKSHRKAKLRLDVRDEALKKEAFVPGKPGESELVKRILTKDPDDLMPPEDSHKKLSQRQKDILQQWIAQGAEYQLHWAYEKPVKAEVPANTNAIDALVQQHLKTLGLKPSPEADRRSLIRRLYSDLIGLPPTPEAVANFVADGSPDAYEKLVDRLLADPHYGERMAMAWLDVVRFADTIGYHSDNPRNIWPYRDYVIKSFTTNKPFDRFTIEQIAGDLLPDANQETRVGSAFNRLLLSTEEGGAQPKDYEARMLTDRVRAVGAAWMGQTTGCAQCHDHKFDPFTQRDFYALGAFFADIKEAVIGRREDGMLVLSDTQQQQLEDISQKIKTMEAEFAKPRADLADAQAAWEKAALQAVADEGNWQAQKIVSAKTEVGNIRVKSKDTTVSANIDDKRRVRNQSDGTDTYIISIKAPAGVTGFRLDAVKEKGNGIGLAANDNFILSEIEANIKGKEKLAFKHASATYEQDAFPAASAIDGKLTDKNNGWGVMGGQGTNQSLYLELAEPLAKQAEITFTLTCAAGEYHCPAHLRLNTTTTSSPIRAPDAAKPSKEIAELLSIPSDKRSEKQRTALHTAYKQIAPELNDLRVGLALAEKTKADLIADAPHCLISVSDSKKRTVRFLPRGNWMDESGEIMQPALPAFLVKASAEKKELTRLDLAQWLIARDNPLTARTVMNRLWKQFFGIGQSKVLDDLGAQGEPPANPALLDWLACEFMDSGWDFRHMVRTIVMSHTYRQVSTSTPELNEADPYNRYCARQTPFRVDAELVRDYALTVSGLLVPTIGGPSVKPYQPAGYWENLNFPPRKYAADTGEKQYRRGLYTWWQRSFLHPSLLAFDAPTREECAADRTRSNIPQQAMVLLNDPTYVEAARAFAVRLVTSGKTKAEDRVTLAWQLMLQRDPRPDEIKTMMDVVNQRAGVYKTDTKAADELLGVGQARLPENIDRVELATWTHVARILLNLHETITRE